jgi:hypothetical protein
VLAASPNWTSSVHIRGCGVGPTQEDGLRRLIYLCYYPKQRVEPVDLPLLLSQTKYKWTLAVDGADVDSATRDMVAHRGAGVQSKLDLMRTHTRLWYWLFAR